MIKRHHVREFRDLARKMAGLLEDVREYCPGANLYLEDSGNWNLMTGDSHDFVGTRVVARQDRAAAMEIVPYSGGGGW